MECPHIKFEKSSGQLLFRGNTYVMCSAGVNDFTCLSQTPVDSSENPVRPINMYQRETTARNDRWQVMPSRFTRQNIHKYDYNGNTIALKSSDYGRTKLFVGGSGSGGGMTLYIAATNDFYNDEKVIFTMLSDYLPVVQNAILKFNYMLCKNYCSNKDCNNVLVNDELAAVIILPDDLFNL